MHALQPLASLGARSVVSCGHEGLAAHTLVQCQCTQLSQRRCHAHGYIGCTHDCMCEQKAITATSPEERTSGQVCLASATLRYLNSCHLCWNVGRDFQTGRTSALVSMQQPQGYLTAACNLNLIVYRRYASLSVMLRRRV